MYEVFAPNCGKLRRHNLRTFIWEQYKRFHKKNAGRCALKQKNKSLTGVKTLGLTYKLNDSNVYVALLQ